MISGETEDAETGPKKPFFPKKFGGVDKVKPKTIPNSVKKKRINFRLRKVIVPKSPIMVLNEMVGAVNYTFSDTHPPMPMMNMNCPPMQLFTATCMVENQSFSGTGPSKQIAKNICAEHVIQFVVTKRCTDPKNKSQQDDSGNPLKPNEMTEETPWAQLASLALFKLFNDWQAQGYVIPNELFKTPDYFNNQGTMKPQGPAGPGGNGQQQQQQQDAPMPPAQRPSQKVPDNPTDRHPVQLLNEMRGPINYELVEKRGENPNCIFVLGASIDGKQYTGEGRNKKDAKKACAVVILKEVHSIVYPVAAPE